MKVVSLVLLPIACASCAQQSHEQTVAELVERAHKLGIVASAGDITATYKASPDDATPDYRALLRRMSGNKDLNVVSNYVREGKDLAAARQSLSEVTELGAMIEKAAKHRDFTPKRDWSSGMGVDFGLTAVMKECCKFLTGRALIEVQSDNAAGCLRDLKLAANVVRHAGSELTVSDLLVHSALVTIWREGAEKSSAILAKDPGALHKMSRLPATFGSPDFIRALGYEIADMRALLAPAKNETQPSKVLTNSYSNVGPYWENVTKEDIIKAEPLYMEKVLDVANAWSDAAKVTKICNSIHGSRLSHAEQMVAELLGVFPQFKIAATRTVTTIATTEIGLTALALHAEGHKWPTLQEAAKAAGVSAHDSFGSGDFKYVAVGNSIQLYSVGPDGKDNGGITSQAVGGKGEYDVSQFEVTTR